MFTLLTQSAFSGYALFSLITLYLQFQNKNKWNIQINAIDQSAILLIKIAIVGFYIRLFGNLFFAAQQVGGVIDAFNFMTMVKLLKVYWGSILFPLLLWYLLGKPLQVKTIRERIWVILLCMLIATVRYWQTLLALSGSDSVSTINMEHSFMEFLILTFFQWVAFAVLLSVVHWVRMRNNTTAKTGDVLK